MSAVFDTRAFVRKEIFESYRDPERFIRTLLGIRSLRSWQIDACNRIRRRLEAGDRSVFVLARTCHTAGKTFFAAAITHWWMTTRFNARGLTLAPTWAQVESALWPEIAKLYNRSLMRELNFGRLLTTKLDFGETWFAVGASSDRPENLEGQHSDFAALRVVDEAKAVEPEVFDATEGLLAAPQNFDLWISTPSIQSGKFYERDSGERPEGLIRVVVSIDDLIADPRITEIERDRFKQWKVERIEEWGEGSAEYQTRALARYADNAEGALFPMSWVERAMSADWKAEGAKLAALDPAGSVDGDQSALAIVSGPDSSERIYVHEVSGWHERDTMISKGKALNGAATAGAKRLRIDSIGLGKGVADAARSNEQGISVEEYRASDKAIAADRFQNRKAEDAWALRQKLEKGLVRLPAHSKLRAQMAAMKYEIKSTGKLAVVDPDDSPDLADAVIIGAALERIGYAASSPDWL